MNQPIEFPKEFERSVRLGEIALEKGELLKAVENFSTAYEIKQDFSVNRALVSSLIEVGEFDDAFDYAREMRRDYFQSVPYLEIYLQILLQKRRFIEAMSLVVTRKETAQTDDEPILADYLERIQQTSAAYQQLEATTIKKVVNELEKMAEDSYLGQLQTVKKLEILPVDTFEELAQKLLVEQGLHQLVRSKILEELVNIQSEKTIDFLGFEENVHSVTPSMLSLPADTSAYQAVSRVLEEYLINDNPSLLLNLMNEVQLHFALLFPFEDENVQDPQLWAQSYLVEYEALTVNNQEEFQRITQVKKLLVAQIQQLYFQ